MGPTLESDDPGPSEGSTKVDAGGSVPWADDPPFLVGSWLTTVIAGGTTHKYGAEWEAAASKRMCLRGICGHNCYTATLSSQIDAS